MVYVQCTPVYLPLQVDFIYFRGTVSSDQGCGVKVLHFTAKVDRKMTDNLSFVAFAWKVLFSIKYTTPVLKQN